MSKVHSRVSAELEDLRTVTADMSGYVASILGAIEVMSGKPGNEEMVRNLASCGQYLMESMSSTVHSFCGQIAEVSQEVH